MTETPVLPTTEGELAFDLAERARSAGADGLIHIAASEGRADRLAHLLWRLAPDVDAIRFPPWDCMPFDRLSPSARVMGLRVAAMAQLEDRPSRAWILLATPDALAQRLPPRGTWSEATATVTVGDAFEPEVFGHALTASGYRADDRVDETGEFALRGAVVDVFPAGYGLPVRIDHADGRIRTIASYDPASQRTSDAFATLVLRPVSEAVLPVDCDVAERPAGLEHRLPELYDDLATLYDYAPAALLTIEPLARTRADSFLTQVAESHETRIRFDRGEGRPLAPERLYLDAAERDRRLAAHRAVAFEEAPDAPPTMPDFALDPHPPAALARFARAERKAGRRIVIAGPAAADRLAVARQLGRALGTSSREVADFAEVLGAEPGALLTLALGLAKGFVTPEAVLVAVADVLGSRAASAGAAAPARSLFAEETFRLGDAVIHLDHGVGVLEGLETIDAAGAGPADTIRLGYAGDAKLMVPISDLELMWRYGSTDRVKADRLDGDSWPKRRAKVEAEIGEAAATLARLAVERRAVSAPKLVPPRRDYERFVARFPFSETPDQHGAVADILRDLASGHPTDRLVCGDVGFGKTEVALRAAAAAVLAGKQVAVVAPTTVLVRQHLDTFRRRFAELGVEVGHLSRLVKGPEAKAVKAGLADGSVRLVIGTHALAGDGVAFADLGLLIIDEEQRFGAADKDKLRARGETVHTLTLTATPIPRTLQSALAGLQDVSVLATPPAERLPVRTILSAFDESSVREALLRERRRGGQSFVVCPRIEDIAPLAERLKALVPELGMLVAHGKMPADAIDDTMVRFAGGDGDVLLATNIIESGLDVPRANTILVWRADQFGLSQLHQLRGRVGRARARGICYLLTEAEAALAATARKRLETLVGHDRLGAGFDISAEDLEQRGAGDLIGDSQAGHVKLIGAGLYRRLLERALVVANGGTPADEWSPELNIGVTGRIPADVVPEPEVRLNLYARIARSRDEATEIRLLEEFEDRFGPPSEAVLNLVAEARIRRLCRTARVARVDAGPQGVALTFKEGGEGDRDLRARLEGRKGLSWKNGRLVLEEPMHEGRHLEIVADLLEAVAPT